MVTGISMGPRIEVYNYLLDEKEKMKVQFSPIKAYLHRMKAE